MAGIDLTPEEIFEVFGSTRPNGLRRRGGDAVGRHCRSTSSRVDARRRTARRNGRRSRPKATTSSSISAQCSGRARPPKRPRRWTPSRPIARM